MDSSPGTMIEVDPFLTITIAIVVYFLGAFLTRHVTFLREFNIPEPVSGGLAASLVTWALLAWFDIQLLFDLDSRDEFLVIFFASIGINARIADLLVSGKLLLTLLLVTVVYIVIQNGVGLVGTHLFDLPGELGVLFGSAALIGGHGTAIAWGPTIESQTGFMTASEIGIAIATIGLVVAALIGGPIAKFLIDRHALSSSETGNPVVGMPYSERGGKDDGEVINHVTLMRSLLAIHFAILAGFLFDNFINSFGIKLPLFVSCLLMGILVSNTIPYLFPKLPWPARTRSLAVISDYSLSLFLAISLMSMQLWTLGEFGITLMAVIIIQAIVAIAFILLIVFRMMGRDYLAAVLSAGFAGFALGATPTAIANMTSVTKRHGPAPMALIILPLVSAFFVDLANALIIQFFLNIN